MALRSRARYRRPTTPPRPGHSTEGFDRLYAVVAHAGEGGHAGHDLVALAEGNRVVERELPDAEVVIPQPFWPAYLTAERIAKATKLKLA
jgi:hypothetical protein